MIILMRKLTAIFSGWLAAAALPAADISGQWRAEIDTQIGVQKYLFTFQVDGEKLTGAANADVNGEKLETKLQEGRLTGDTVGFVEPMNFQGSDIRIEYEGKIGANEIQFTRHVGDFATEDFLAKRVEPVPAEMATNASADNRPADGSAALHRPRADRALAGLSMGAGQADADHVAELGFMPAVGEPVHEIHRTVLVGGQHADAFDARGQQDEVENDNACNY
jgi:hypothetical protein